MLQRMRFLLAAVALGLAVLAWLLFRPAAAPQPAPVAVAEHAAQSTALQEGTAPSRVRMEAQATPDGPAETAIQQPENTGASAQATEGSSEVSIPGRVLSPRGEPAQAARILVSYLINQRPARQLVLQSDAAGRFRFTLGAQEQADISAEWQDELGIYAAERSAVVAGKSELVLNLVAVPGFTLRVVDESGAPVTRFGYALSSRPEPGRAPLSRSSQIMERPGGRVVLPHWNELQHVLVEAEGFQPWTRTQLQPAPHAELLVELERVGELTGIVVAADRRIAGARVGLQRGTKPGETLRIDGLPTFMHEVFHDEVVTNEQGEFRIPVSERADWHLRVRSKGYATLTTAAIRCDPAPPTEPVVVELKQPATLEGTVRSPDGRAVPGAHVFATNGSPPARSVRADDAGFYRLTDLPPGDLFVVARKQGPGTMANTFRSAAPARAGAGQPAESPQCTLGPGATLRLDLVMEASSSLRLKLPPQLPFDADWLRSTALVRRAAAAGAPAAEWIVEGEWNERERSFDFEFPGTGQLVLSVHLREGLSLSLESDLAPGAVEFTLDVSGASVEFAPQSAQSATQGLVLRGTCRSASAQQWIANYDAPPDAQARTRQEWMPHGTLRQYRPKSSPERSYEHQPGSALRIEW